MPRTVVASDDERSLLGGFGILNRPDVPSIIANRNSARIELLMSPLAADTEDDRTETK